MKESYREQPAIDFGHKPYAGNSGAPGVASAFAKASPYAEASEDKMAGQKWVRGSAGQPLNSEIKIPLSGLVLTGGRQHRPHQLSFALEDGLPAHLGKQASCLLFAVYTGAHYDL